MRRPIPTAAAQNARYAAMDTSPATWERSPSNRALGP